MEHSLIKYIVVSAGAALGGALRYWLTDFTQKYIPVMFPIGTLAVNFTGSIALGIIIFFFDDKEMLSLNLKLFLTIGICGGFTTMSTFSFETINLMRDSQFFYAFLNIVLNVFLSLSGIYLGYLISRFQG